MERISVIVPVFHSLIFLSWQKIHRQYDCTDREMCGNVLWRVQPGAAFRQ